MTWLGGLQNITAQAQERNYSSSDSEVDTARCVYR